ncbi:MAG: magnesium chelatase [Tepidiforma sp.]|nr:MAG: magnesium chelatase [Tepidiforma sp.]
MSGPVFPFAAIVGQEEMKLALLLNVIDPGLGGVLIRGGKGTAKSTAVRALAELLPPIEATEGCPFGCGPGEQPECPGRDRHGDGRIVARRPRLVTLPVGASEERLVGSLDIEAALGRGERVVEPGLLAAAHRGVLYVDEVNLLADHLVDALLDAAAMGRNYIERDGISATHPARFVLVGTMNPEEGELRPQLLDRFGLMVEAEQSLEPALRAEVVRRRIAFERDPEGFAARWARESGELAARIRAAREAVEGVEVPDGVLEAMVSVCAACEVDGMRADLALYRAARAHAAWEGRRRATVADVRAVAPLVLGHRRRRLPFEQPGVDRQQVESALEAFDEEGDGEGQDGAPAEPGPSGGGEPGGQGPAEGRGPEAAGGDGPGEGARRAAAIGDPRRLEGGVLLQSGGRRSTMTGRRRRRRAPGVRGRHIGAEPWRGAAGEVDAAATLRAAAVRGPRRALPVPREDWRVKLRAAEVAALVVMVVDASGSMGARRRMEAAKGAVLGLLQDAYLRRDRVAFVAFDGKGARLLLGPTRSVDEAHRALGEFGTGGRTPLWAGLAEAAAVTARARRRDPDLPVLVVLVTDGRANAGAGGLDPVRAAVEQARALRAAGADALVVDTEEGPVRLGIAGRLAEALGGALVRLDELEPRRLWEAVRMRRAEAAR